MTDAPAKPRTVRVRDLENAIRMGLSIARRSPYWSDEAEKGAQGIARYIRLDLRIVDDFHALLPAEPEIAASVTQEEG